MRMFLSSRKPPASWRQMSFDVLETRPNQGCSGQKSNLQEVGLPCSTMKHSQMRWSFFNRIFIVLVVIVSCTVLAACSGWPTMTVKEDIYDPQSPLLTALVQRSDFSPGWHWLRESTTVEPGESITGDSNIIESAFRGLGGTYNSDRIYMHLYHRLELHSKPVLSETIQLSDAHLAGEVISLEIPPLGRSVKSRCVRETPHPQGKSIVCQVVVGYEYITSDLIFEISGDDYMEFEILQMTVREVLLSVDNRVGEINTTPE
jgi:hypothetical protein